MKIVLIIFYLSVVCLVYAHEGHQHNLESVNVEDTILQGRPKDWIEWIGRFHLIFLHFPVALINLLVVSEILLAWTGFSSFDFTSRFLIVAAAIMSPATALLGYIYSLSAPYEGVVQTFLFWHMWLGFTIAVLAIVAAFLRMNRDVGKAYYVSLFILFLLVNFVVFLGGSMTFGPYHMHFPVASSRIVPLPLPLPESQFRERDLEVIVG